MLRWWRFKTVLLASVTLLEPAARAADAPPIPARTAPPIFASVNYGIEAQIPHGLAYCPKAKNWEGSDHGTEVYLAPPRACIPDGGYPSSSRSSVGDVPTITIFYGYNLAEIESGDYSGPPRTDAELFKSIDSLGCEGPGRSPLPAGLRLLGRTPVGCRTDRWGKVILKAEAVYDIYSAHEEGQAPDGELELALATTRQRFDQDLKVFAAILSNISLCTPDGTKPIRGRKSCPQERWF